MHSTQLKLLHYIKKERIVPFGMNLLNECPELNLIVVGRGLLIENTTGPKNCFLRKTVKYD